MVCLGGFAWESALRLRAALGAPMPRPKPKFGHGAVADGEPWPLLGCFHPSQQNTFTGKLTPPMMDAVLRAGARAGLREALRRRSCARRTSARWSRRRCWRGSRSASTRSRSSSTCASRRGSFAIAGAVSGALAAGSGVGAPVQGRLVDRSARAACWSRSRCVHAAALGAIVAFAELGAPTAVLVACGFVAGFAIPPTSSVLRSLWTDLLPSRRLHQAAYALDSTMIELIFISGPLLTALIARAAHPAGALIVSAVAVVAGTAIFTALPPTRARRAGARTAPAGLLGALASPGVRTLVLTSLPTGIGIGMLEVGIPAFSRAEGAAAAAGVLLGDLVVRQRGSAGCSTARCPRRPRLVPDAPVVARAAAARRCSRSPPRRRCG